MQNIPPRKKLKRASGREFNSIYDALRQFTKFGFQIPNLKKIPTEFPQIPAPTSVF
jgi:hypothetical protein